MSSSYFKNFPKIKYFNVLSTNISLRTAFIERLKLNASVFYPYIIEENETADGLATDYYGSPEYDWLIYLANNIIDPHTQWPKTYLQFESYIVKKYGSKPIKPKGSGGKLNGINKTITLIQKRKFKAALLKLKKAINKRII